MGPIWQGGEQGEAQLLEACYQAVFEIAYANGIRSLALPAISCGVYGYPHEQAVAIAVHEVRAGMQRFDTIRDVIFACFSPAMLHLYEEALGGPS